MIGSMLVTNPCYHGTEEPEQVATLTFMANLEGAEGEWGLKGGPRLSLKDVFPIDVVDSREEAPTGGFWDWGLNTLWLNHSPKSSRQTPGSSATAKAGPLKFPLAGGP